MNKHVEPEQADKSYQLYGDGTMLVKVDGTYQRRTYEVVDGPTNEDVIWPETHDGEQVLHTPGGDVSIITTKKPVVLVPVDEEMHPLARLADIAEELKRGLHTNSTSRHIENLGIEIAKLVAELSQKELTAKPVTVAIDATEAVAAAQDYVARFRMRTHGAMNASLEAGWRAYLDAPMARDMGRSKFNAGVTAAITYIMDNVLKD